MSLGVGPGWRYLGTGPAIGLVVVMTLTWYAGVVLEGVLEHTVPPFLSSPGKPWTTRGCREPKVIHRRGSQGRLGLDASGLFIPVGRCLRLRRGLPADTGEVRLRFKLLGQTTPLLRVQGRESICHPIKDERNSSCRDVVSLGGGVRVATRGFVDDSGVNNLHLRLVGRGGGSRLSLSIASVGEVSSLGNTLVLRSLEIRDAAGRWREMLSAPLAPRWRRLALACAISTLFAGLLLVAGRAAGFSPAGSLWRCSAVLALGLLLHKLGGSISSPELIAASRLMLGTSLSVVQQTRLLLLLLLLMAGFVFSLPPLRRQRQIDNSSSAPRRSPLFVGTSAPPRRFLLASASALLVGALLLIVSPEAGPALVCIFAAALAGAGLGERQGWSRGFWGALLVCIALLAALSPVVFWDGLRHLLPRPFVALAIWLVVIGAAFGCSLRSPNLRTSALLQLGLLVTLELQAGSVLGTYRKLRTDRLQGIGEFVNDTVKPRAEQLGSGKLAVLIGSGASALNCEDVVTGKRAATS